MNIIFILIITAFYMQASYIEVTNSLINLLDKKKQRKMIGFRIICEGFVEQNSERIKFISKYKEGSSFVFTLKLA